MLVFILLQYLQHPFWYYLFLWVTNIVCVYLFICVINYQLFSAHVPKCFILPSYIFTWCFIIISSSDISITSFSTISVSKMSLLFHLHLTRFYLQLFGLTDLLIIVIFQQLNLHAVDRVSYRSFSWFQRNKVYIFRYHFWLFPINILLSVYGFCS